MENDEHNDDERAAIIMGHATKMKTSSCQDYGKQTSTVSLGANLPNHQHMQYVFGNKIMDGNEIGISIPW